MQIATNPKTLLQTLKRFKSERDYDRMLMVAQEAVQLFPEVPKFQKLLFYAQAHYVHEKLNSHVVEQLEEKNDYFNLAAVYQKLLGIFPESAELMKLLKQVRNKIKQAQREERQTYFDQAKKEILHLMEIKDWGNALEACYEIQSYDPENKSFDGLTKKVESHFYKEVDTAIDDYFEKATPVLKAQYKKDKETFLEI